MVAALAVSTAFGLAVLVLAQENTANPRAWPGTTDSSAMQILSCDGETIAGHVPIGETMLRAIEAAAAELLDLEE